MQCQNCKKENPKKIFIVGQDYERGTQVACDSCIKKKSWKNNKEIIKKSKEYGRI